MVVRMLNDKEKVSRELEQWIKKLKCTGSTGISLDPLIRDPYELRFTEVQRSRIPGASEGIFTKQDIEPNTIIAFYNGSRADPVEFDPTTWETNNYRIFDPADIPNGTIDIPIWAQDVKRYCGTLAHKCNHSFLPNAEFVVFDHPKFGLIPCITSTTDIYAGEEILVGYGYDLNDSPDWYTQAWHNSIFAAQGVSYQDWMDCNVKRPFNIKETRRDA
ncbi:histone-lysine N-methyltransferase SETD7 isoform X2 [Eurytemora carolleeae]|uniref:histone-lysine N-methyltransferase SETD7 isoform X2 n=1 Tax=Eurytemora carolleeae TaxID=1294199 RepID=UPI000C790250|nr:histone-lysine N-methyltransferase SETD7 isoform X2 [Eurytemora carolleeae]XP_023325684.1 histone-lysine N-methyltransferase SETD7 isoform X2 [Eurytemora carolleeae]|eukprot:XP_023325683.1 histone-lysine N-methyltransferase SETD7-like isoform X2 [Eurytemora affinis]